MEENNGWLPIREATREDQRSGTKIDCWAKRWNAEDDNFEYARFPDCQYGWDDHKWTCAYTSLAGWKVTHFKRVLPGPKS